MRMSKFEIGAISLLLALASLHSASGLTGWSVGIGHIVSLLVLFTLSRGLITQISQRAGRLFFAVIALMLVAEILIQYLIGLHLNWFVISLLIEGNLKQNTGMSAPVFGTILLAATAALYLASAFFGTATAARRAPKIILVGLVAAAVTQFIYGTAYYHGSTDAVQARRTMPFFWTVHPYQMNKLLSYVFAPRGDNPFSLSHVSAANPTDSTQPKLLAPIADRVGGKTPNVLVIVTDSLRASDIRENPGLAPNLFSAAQDGFFSLDHYSVSNCTHFSLYSMATGQLPTRYGDARKQKNVIGLFSEMAAAGYRVSTAESASLDWYDLSDIIIPAAAERWTGANDDTLENDKGVTGKTIEKLSEWQQSEVPGLHFAYYHGTHYPYSDTLNDSTATKFDAYQSAIGLFDAELAKILAALDALNLRDNTLVIVTSDHGEEFYDDGRVGHASRLSMQQVQVPLLVLGAGEIISPRSHLDIPSLIYAEVEPGRQQPQPSEVIYLANCGYDFPSGFSVLKSEQRYDFDFDNGYLIPVPTDDQPASASIKAVAAELLAAIR